MARAAKATIDHDFIRRWVEERGGTPAHVKRSGGRRGPDDPGILRIDFPGWSGEGTLEPISWEQWFEAFEANRLAFLHQDEKLGDQPSRFNKLVSRDTVELGAEAEQMEEEEAAAPSRARPRAGQVDINAASVEELSEVEGVGEARAQHIIDYREQNGPFRSVDDIEQVPGISRALADKIKPQVTAGQPAKRAAQGGKIRRAG
ncbi:MAG: helix-hairpin-helix domain-containing protein [Polyangiaceae bacterium]|nr:helix-hairpin-helix domain-containing protein [Polyangiaceae bacterium]